MDEEAEDDWFVEPGESFSLRESIEKTFAVHSDSVIIEEESCHSMRRTSTDRVPVGLWSPSKLDAEDFPRHEALYPVTYLMVLMKSDCQVFA